MMENAVLRSDTINALRYGADSALAMLAGMQLDIFSSLSSGPLPTEQFAEALGVAPTRLPLLLYALVAAEQLIEEDDHQLNGIAFGGAACMYKAEVMDFHQAIG